MEKRGFFPGSSIFRLAPKRNLTLDKSSNLVRRNDDAGSLIK
jgi:hypothetical protein